MLRRVLAIKWISGVLLESLAAAGRLLALLLAHHCHPLHHHLLHRICLPAASCPGWPGFLEPQEEFQLVDDFGRPRVAELEFMGEPVQAVAPLLFFQKVVKLPEVDRRIDRFQAVGRLEGQQLGLRREDLFELFDGVLGQQPIEAERDLNQVVRRRGVSRSSGWTRGTRAVLIVSRLTTFMVWFFESKRIA